MEIEGTTFGTITIDGKTYDHDVIIRRSCEVVKRKKKLSKKYYGTSHMLSKDEAKFVFEPGCEQLILGSGQMSSSLIQVTVVPVFTVTRSGAKANWSMCTSLVGAEPSAQSGGMSRWLCQWLGDCTPVSPRGRRARSPRSARAQAAGLMWVRMILWRFATGPLLALSVALSAVAQDCIIGVASVEIHGQRIRLFGIDAPESSQLCMRASGERWRCGQQASFALADRIGRASVSCQPRDLDRYGRVVAVCFKGIEDLNRWMVANGWAVAFKRYSLDYVADEAAAGRKIRLTSGPATSICRGSHFQVQRGADFR